MPEPDLTTQTPPEDQAEPELSFAEHEAQFVADKPSHTDDLRLDVEKVTKTAAEATEPPERGNVARKHRANREDVPRIHELVNQRRQVEAKYAELEAKYAELEKKVSAPAPVAVAKPAPEPAPVVEARPPAQARSGNEPIPEPKLADFEDWDKYWDARTDWKIGEARRVERLENERVAAAQQLSSAWREKVTAAKNVYPDFEDVALRQETQIPQGSLIDRWVLEHKNGAHLLYYLQKNPSDVQRLVAMAPEPTDNDLIAWNKTIALSDELSQLALRLLPSRASGVATGAPAARVMHPGPRPPTPVRTAPQRAADEPPGDDATLAQHEAYFNEPRRRRR